MKEYQQKFATPLSWRWKLAFSHLSFKVEVLFTSLVQKQNEKKYQVRYICISDKHKRVEILVNT